MPSLTIGAMDHHTLAALSLAGIALDVLGSLYLAYDLLGGRHGPLRLLTRMVTYSIVFGFGYALGLGLWFGLTAGVATGLTVAIELNRTARGLPHYPLRWEALFSSVRGLGFATGLYRIAGIGFATAFGVLVTLGQIVAYHRGTRPGIDYSPSRHPRFTARQFRATVERSIGYILTSFVCGATVTHIEHDWALALRIGLVTGAVTGVGTTVNPIIEYYADHLPERRLGTFGIGLILCGFTLQSLQYWIALLDVRLS